MSRRYLVPILALGIFVACIWAGHVLAGRDMGPHVGVALGIFGTMLYLGIAAERSVRRLGLRSIAYVLSVAFLLALLSPGGLLVVVSLPPAPWDGYALAACTWLAPLVYLLVDRRWGRGAARRPAWLPRLLQVFGVLSLVFPVVVTVAVIWYTCS